jgi:hypothetical protein
MSVTSTALRSNVRRGRCAPRRQVGSACSHARGGGGRHRLGWLPVGEGGRPPVGAVRRGGVDRVKATTVAIAGEQRLRPTRPRSTNGWQPSAPTMRCFR